MRILTIIICAALIGGIMGAAVAYVEVRPRGEALARVAEQTASTPAARAAIAEGDVPRVLVEEPNFNFGKMERGREKSHEFVIRNVGTAPLKLKVGATSCKCTLSELSGNAIAPGESTQVRLEWKALSEQGMFRQTATIHTNDPLQPEVELTIEGEVVNATGVEPPDFIFDKLAVGETRSVDVYVMTMLQDELIVHSAELSDPSTRDRFDVKVEPLEREDLPNPSAQDGARITLTARPGLPVGRFDQSLTLRTNLKEGEVLHIPVIGRVVGDITVHGTGWLPEQDALLMGPVKSSEGRTSRLNLVVRGENAGDVEFKVASIDPSELKVRIGEPNRIKDTLLHVPVEIEVPAGTRPMVRLDTAQGDAAKVVLKTTHPTMKEIALSVRFAVVR